MIDARATMPHRGPTLLCAGTEPAGAARLAEAVTRLLADRPAVVLATWEPPLLLVGLDAVRDAMYDTGSELRAAAQDAADEAARTACDVLEAHGLDVTTRACPDERPPWQVILELGDEIDAAVIVAGASAGSLPHPGALGSQARALAHRSRRPLLVLPVDAVADVDVSAPAIFAYDGSAAAGRAVDVAARLLCPRPAIVASVWQSASHTVSVARLAVPDEIARRGADALDDVSRGQAEDHATGGAALLAAAGSPSETAVLETARAVSTAIIDAADEHDAAIIVTGTRGRSRVAAALLGSSAEDILRHARRPVLLVSSATDRGAVLT